MTYGPHEIESDYNDENHGLCAEQLYGVDLEEDDLSFRFRNRWFVTSSHPYPLPSNS